MAPMQWTCSRLLTSKGDKLYLHNLIQRFNVYSLKVKSTIPVFWVKKVCDERTLPYYRLTVVRLC